MNIGMLWFDDDPKRTFEEKVRRAAAYYGDKYGRQPTVCLVHPGTLEQYDSKSTVVDGIAVREFRTVLPKHLWIGVDAIDLALSQPEQQEPIEK